MDVVFKLTEGLKDPEKAKSVIDDVQQSIDGLVSSNEKVLAEAEKASKLSAEFEKLCRDLEKSNLELVEAVKNIHLILNKHRDRWEDLPDMQEVIKGLGQFVTSAGVIKAGVVAEAERRDKENGIQL